MVILPIVYIYVMVKEILSITPLGLKPTLLAANLAVRNDVYIGSDPLITTIVM